MSDEALVIPVFTAPVAAPVAPIESMARSDYGSNVSHETPEALAVEEGKPVETPEQIARRGQNRIERKIGRMLREASEQRARADFYEAKLAEQTPKPQTDAGAPTLESSGYDPEKYATDKAIYEVERTFTESVNQQQDAQQRAMQNSMNTAWEEKANKGADKYDDWDQIVGNIKPDTPMIFALFEAENGADIAHYLGSHPEEAKRIMGLHPASQFREIGRLEARLAANPVKVITASRAPAPIVPITGMSSPSSTVIKDGMSFEDFRRIRNKQLGRK